jgi:NAD(P)-dependent dehydrogenase (short-subunit alcohol dehydrogenase family)
MPNLIPQLPVPEILSEKWDHIFVTKLKSVFHAAQVSIKFLYRQHYGKIISISSSSVKSGGVAAGKHYAPTKATVICLANSLVPYSAPFGVNVNSVCPVRFRRR